MVLLQAQWGRLLPIQTSRLTLLPCTIEAATAILQNRTNLEKVLDVRVADEKLADEDLEPYLTYRRELESDEGLFGWGPWLIVQNAESVLIGSAGFKGKPNREGIVEIGYGVVPAYRGQGYGFEAVEALVNWAFSVGVKSIMAECQPDNIASVRILERLGMRCVGKQKGLLKWELKGTA